ncbi:hypothetical protein D9M71_177080 [compost metagenome]
MSVGFVYSLVTHKNLFAGDPNVARDTHPSELWSRGKAVLVLALATLMIAWISEILVAAIEPFWSSTFRHRLSSNAKPLTLKVKHCLCP